MTTGAFRVTELPDAAALLDELGRVAPAEFLVSDDPGQVDVFHDFNGTRPYDAHAFVFEQADFALREHFRVQSLDGFGCGSLPRAVSAAGAIFHYLQHQMRRSLEHVTALGSYRPSSFLVLDAVSQTHLEIIRPRNEGGTSLLRALDRTVTPLGARQLRQWLLYPLREVTALEARQQLIADLLANPDCLRQGRESLREVRDLERTVGRLSQSGGNARDLRALGASLAVVPELKRLLAALPCADEDGHNLARRIDRKLHPLTELAARLEGALAPEPPAGVKEGGMFRDGYHAGLDEFRRAATGGRDWIAALQKSEVERTGIKSLKIGYNSVFGYYIELTKSNLGSVPPDYQRKQTTAGGERFVTTALKDMEIRILGADERARQLEAQLFQELREEVLRDTILLQQTAQGVAAFDALASLAETARLFNYCRPRLREPGATSASATGGIRCWISISPARSSCRTTWRSTRRKTASSC